MKFVERRIKNIVIGSGAAGFQAVLRLQQNGEKEVVLVTENRYAGTSRNTGSDKQTYYKLSLAGGNLDSVRAMAEDLFSGQCVDGDQALCEAALSAQSFFRLVELGVPFPCTEQGEFMGYKTDHDRGRRATSAGPYTSRMMTECLEKSAEEHQIEILDFHQVIRLLVFREKIYGILCLNIKEMEPSYRLIWCENVIMATGGPAGMYYDSVYPESQKGSSGLAFEAGVKGKNLTEWQFGMASKRPRWNVSGTYMQVLPRFLSTKQDGSDEKEFLLDYFEKPEEMLSLIFLKGYQWPFDVNKIYGGSSVIDLLVYQETILKGRRVYLDFTENTEKKEIPFEKISKEAREYLGKADALFGRPIERLKQMNEPAILFYQDQGVDLYREKLEIAVCVQHNNGGLSTDCNWETNIHGLFAAGEVCGSHGVTRPGGTALNAGQVGAMRAAQCIYLRNLLDDQNDEQIDSEAEGRLREEALKIIELSQTAEGDVAANEMWIEASKRMSASGGMIRSEAGLKEALEITNEILENFRSIIKKPSVNQLSDFYRLRETLLAQKVYLSAMLDYCSSGAGSRGSALYTNKMGEKPDERFPELYRCKLDQDIHGGVTQEIRLKDGNCVTKWRPVHPIPDVDYFFENQWKNYRERRKI